MDISDTIAAVATPPGRGGIGIIRVSGNKATDAMKMLFRSRSKYVSPEPNKLYYGDFIDLKSNTIDSGFAVFMKSPYSYTGENTVEFQLHGSPAVLSAIMLVLNQIGIRTANPGEFSQRAFLNGRMDILQAEAVLDLINAGSDKAYKIAISQLKGDLSIKINNLKREVIDVLSGLDAIIDFPESVNEEMDIKKIEESLTRIKNEIESLLKTYRTGRILKEGLLFHIVGRTNTGKSTLFNALLGRERAIVHHEPGTTRDYIEEELTVNGNFVRLMDSAGIRQSGDEVEEEGIRRAMEIFNEADAYLFVIDCSTPLTDVDMDLIERIRGRRGIVVLNKCDLGKKTTINSCLPYFADWKIMYISGKTGQGIPELKDEIRNLLRELTPYFESGIITRARHYECLNSCLMEIYRAIESLSAGAGIVVTADNVRGCLKRLGEMTGEELDEAVLDRIFNEFCIGK